MAIIRSVSRDVAARWFDRFRSQYEMTAGRLDHTAGGAQYRSWISRGPYVDRRRIECWLLHQRTINRHRLPALRQPQACAVDHAHDLQISATAEIDSPADRTGGRKETAGQALADNRHGLSGLIIAPCEFAARHQAHSGQMKEPGADRIEDGLEGRLPG